MTTKLTTQAQRSQEKKRKIFEVSMEMFRQKGYNQTTIRDICAAAHITIGTFYNFYGDKSGILLEYFRQLTNERSHILEHSPDNLADPYQAICDYFMTVVDMQDRFGRDLSREFASHGASLLISGMGTIPPGIHQIALLLASSTATHTDPLRTAEYLVSGFMGTMQYWYNLTQRESMRDVAQRLLPLVFAAVTDKPISIK